MRRRCTCLVSGYSNWKSRPSKECRELSDVQVELLEIRIPSSALDERDLFSYATVGYELGQVSRVMATSKQYVTTQRII